MVDKSKIPADSKFIRMELSFSIEELFTLILVLLVNVLLNEISLKGGYSDHNLPLYRHKR